MYVNGNKVFSTGTLVLNAGESGAIDLPLGPLNLAFLNETGVGPHARQNGATLEFINLDAGGEFSGTFNFDGAAGTAIAGRKIYLVYAIHGVTTPAGTNWVISFTVTLA